MIGDFILPPPDGEPTRDFQTLHFDFGVPLHPVRDQDVARYTALFIPPSAARVTAVTQLVSLDALLGQRRWPDQRHCSRTYSRTAGRTGHGVTRTASARALARVLEGAAGAARLPSVKSTPGFLCGMEFDDLAAEVTFLASLGLGVEAVQVEVPLGPGDVLVFDNLDVAHGQRGNRAPGELHQRVYGNRSSSRRLSARFATTSLPCSRSVNRAAAIGAERDRVGRARLGRPDAAPQPGE